MEGKIIIESIQKNMGGGFTAYHNSARFICGDGETPAKALDDFILHYGKRYLSAHAVDAKKPSESDIIDAGINFIMDTDLGGE